MSRHEFGPVAVDDSLFAAGYTAASVLQEDDGAE